jgi:exodeoxyribonuclease V alpha subunit
VVIVDEASMIGVGLFAKLLSAMKPMSRLIILGDSEQLASVDSGSLFGDLCSGLKLNENQFEAHHLDFINAFLREDRKLGGDYVLKESTTVLDQHLVRLKKTYRYDQNSKMGQFTKAVIHGQEDKLDDILQISEDSLVLDEFYEEAVFNNFIKGYYKFIEEPDINKALEKLNHCRVLCAVRQGDQGIYKINARIESQLKAHYKNQKTHSFHPTDGFYHNQPIMVTQNTPEINLFNGDVGIVRKDENGRLKAYFVNPKKETDGKDLMLINPASIPAWETVFAMTIHKSQGSEFNKVLVLLPKQQENRILTRELLYTGVTRAKEKAIIQSSLDLIKSTTQKAVNRVSGVQDRIQCSSTKK